MKLGIIDADILADEFIPRYHSYAAMLQSLLAGAAPDCKFNTYSALKFEYPDQLDECDGYLITGSKHAAYDDKPWIRKLREFIRLAHGEGRPLFGICFGHQIIADALGGKVAPAEQGWGVGVHAYSTLPEARSMFPALGDIFSLIVSHRDQVTQLPNTAVTLASSTFCPIAAFAIGDKVLCFQGHPEFEPAYAEALMQKRADDIPEATRKRAKESLGQSTQHTLVAECIISFLRNSIKSK